MSKYSGITQKEASELIAEKIEFAKRALSECEDIAREHGLGFRFDGPNYGMGGYFDGASDGWESSSQSC